jgi:hypothetical protein
VRSRYLPVLITAAIFSLLLALQSNFLYQTGEDWFETCWAVKNTKDAKPATAKEAIKWAQCESVASEAVYGAGFQLHRR